MSCAMVKAVIIIGGPQKGTRFRPLSLDTPKPLFPVAGMPLLQHHIETCAQLKYCKEIIIIGSYTTEQMAKFMEEVKSCYNFVHVRYLQEFTPLGTGGGLYHFRDQIRAGNPTAFFLINGDVCADMKLDELFSFHLSKEPDALVTVMGTEATKQQSVHYGCMVSDVRSNAVTHYVEKPDSYVSALINCGVYVCSLQVFNLMAKAFENKQGNYYRGNGTGTSHPSYMSWELDVLAPLAGTDRLFVMQVTRWWSQMKTAGSAIYANRHFLELYKRDKPEMLMNSSDNKCCIIDDVCISRSATIASTAVIGPNVSIGAGVTIKDGVRIKESIILDNATIEEHALVMYSVVGKHATVGKWARVEGTPADPDPNKQMAKVDNTPLFNLDGRLNPSITILGASVNVPAETILLNSIVLPHKHLSRSIKHEIIL